MTIDDIASWMLGEVMREGTVSQEDIAWGIEKRFGDEFVPTNDHGNPSIRRDVLEAFKKISKLSVVWMATEKAWRKREPGDKVGRKQD
jgi:hypothetical protein